MAASRGTLSDLERLELRGTKITDAGFVHLHGLKKLKPVGGAERPSDRGGARKFKEAQPQVLLVVSLTVPAAPAALPPEATQKAHLEKPPQLDTECTGSEVVGTLESSSTALALNPRRP